MLVLSRKVGERLVIGDNIAVVVSRVAGNRVTLGIEAPADVRIVRGELKAETDEAAQRQAAPLPKGSFADAPHAAHLAVAGLAK
jgi:carbon storage regulator